MAVWLTFEGKRKQIGKIEAIMAMTTSEPLKRMAFRPLGGFIGPYSRI